MTVEPDLTLWTFKFVVRATKWDDAAKTLKDTLGIEAKRDTSDRKIDGMYMVSCIVNDDKLTKGFYDSLTKSTGIAIHSDTKSDSLYSQILNETQVVEERLRWLLLHVSDAFENYAEHVKAKDGEIIDAKSLDPITSKLSFESIITILEIDLSWTTQGVSIDKVNEIIADTTDHESLMKRLIDEATPRIIWDAISNLVLEKPVKWQTLKSKLNKIKCLRNDCAHFRTVTDDHLVQAKSLRSQTMHNLARKQKYTSADIEAFTGLSRQLAAAMKGISTLQARQIQPFAESVLAAQKSILESAGLSASLNNSMRLSQSVARQFFENSNLDAIIKAPTMAFSSLPRFSFPVLEKTTLDSIKRAHESLRDLNMPSQPNEDEGSNSDDSVDPEESTDDSQPPQPSAGNKKGKKR